MAGVKQFDPDEVIGRATNVFWTRGYESTSIDDLVQATGINRASLYNTFGDKQGLFLAAVDRYWATFADSMISALADTDPQRAIAGMFDSIIERISNPRFPRGCFITNTSLECPASGDAIARKINECMARQQTAIYRTLRKSQLEGRIGPEADVKALACFFMGVAQGINVVHKATADLEALKDIVKIALSVLQKSQQRTPVPL
jgi:TetR/AcrR family transcriptional regulator, transcriptional repressor for nem operon